MPGKGGLLTDGQRLNRNLAADGSTLAQPYSVLFWNFNAVIVKTWMFPGKIFTKILCFASNLKKMFEI